MITCPSCKTANPPGIGLCKQCGGKIPLEEAVAAHDDASPGAASSFEEQIVALLRKGGKIEAVKLYRAQTGKDLKDSLDAVTAIAQKHNLALPKSGCAGMLLAMCLLGVAFVWIASHVVG